jgi:hypothetical protein
MELELVTEKVLHEETGTKKLMKLEQERIKRSKGEIKTTMLIVLINPSKREKEIAHLLRHVLIELFVKHFIQLHFCP